MGVSVVIKTAAPVWRITGSALIRQTLDVRSLDPRFTLPLAHGAQHAKLMNDQIDPA